ncbi:MAG: GNAT family N-acetyltransferase [Patescibacteria group bacterium]
MKTHQASKTSFFQRYEQAYISRQIKNPDKGSNFEIASRYFRWLPEYLLIQLLKIAKYDGILFYENDQIIGHIFYQKHPEGWKVFSVHVSDNLRGKGYGQKMISTFLITAHNQGLKRVRIGAGGSVTLEHICTKVISGGLTLPFKVRRGDTTGWLNFVQ